MRSPTQPALEADHIAGIVRDGLGVGVSEASELGGGGFAAVWRASLTDGRDVVVKVGPPPSARLLAYEAGMLPSEVTYYSLVRDLAPVPVVLAHTDDWIISTLLPGAPLTEVESTEARRQLGAAVARVHTLTGQHFGYTGDRPSGSSWPSAFAAMIDSLRADADAWNVRLPAFDLDRFRPLLATVIRPALLHFDLWDGNVLAAPDGSLSGLVDGERYLYGDPLLDFVSPALGRRITPSHPFAAGYGIESFTADEQTRIALYRIHLYLLMLAEGPSRGIEADDDRQQWVRGLLDAELADL
ncbi:aminoglycoside phosphotransferase family protein [Actinoplanes sp. LDG1-06]|uniref:Aminoglycoside phosphotransferase family protein n=1 Tax=Paractinoplanes ovalisporus TaxID=2810368 RepID=A0ABS2ASP3_9ACTN|nr:aminoglycoside phosphotransferase family protein [Actinoplanes ovalisporus]MBM2622854.1 aminoglycoside phosphotransferase family protein [Actinoplanes ovalisporus]